MQDPTTPEPTLYRLGQKSAFWAALTPTQGGLRQSWWLGIAARGRGGKLLAPLVDTGGQRVLASVTVRGEVYPLPIDRHEARRGGGLTLGGTRKLGTDGTVVDWEMRWLPLAGEEGAFTVEMRLRATPKRTGTLHIHLRTPLFQPEGWQSGAAQLSSSGAACLWSAHHGHFLSAAADVAVEETEKGGLALGWPAFAFGGGKLVRFSVRFGAAGTLAEACARTVTQHAALLADTQHLLNTVTRLDPADTMARLTAPDAYAVQGAERLYLKPPTDGDEGSFYAALPHDPAGALAAFGQWNRLHPADGVETLVRYGTRGLCADFQVMGRDSGPEPNKGAFWDKMTCGVGTDAEGGPTHGIASNARLARHLFALAKATGDPLAHQSGLNIGQWLLLKQNEAGFYDGARVQATRGLSTDGRVIVQPCALDGAEAIRAFIAAYHATQSEVWIRAANRVAYALLENRGRDFDCLAPASVASVILSLIALDAEAPQPRLRTALREWGSWLRSLPLSAALPSLNADGLHAGLYECADAGLHLWNLTRDFAYLRYAFAALALVPEASRKRSWRAVALHQSALLSLAALLPDAKVSFAAPSVTLDWRVFTADPAAAPSLTVAPTHEAAWADWLPLVCRATDQLLLLVLAPPGVETVTVTKSGRQPLLHDLRTGRLDAAAPLGFVGKEKWGRAGLFVINP